MRRLPLLSIAATVALAAPLAIAVPVSADDGFGKPSRPWNRLLVCDTTGCLIAWDTIDSDGDGYSNADEKAAGTDPFDPASHPLLVKVFDLAAAHKLPTFEYGVSTFVALPPDIVKLTQQALGGKSLPAQLFPIESRAERLKRMGIDSDLLKQAGISLTGNGFALGAGKFSQVAGVEVQGRQVTLFDGHVVEYTPGEKITMGSVHGQLTGMEKGGLFDSWSWRYTYEDGTTQEVGDDGWSHYSDGSSSFHEQTKQPDGSYQDVDKSYGPDGQLLAERESLFKSYGDGSTNNYWKTTIPVYGDDGKQTGTITQEGQFSNSSTGSGTGGETVTYCDNAGTCTETNYYYEDGEVYQGTPKGEGETGSASEPGDYEGGSGSDPGDTGDPGDAGDPGDTGDPGDEGGTGVAYADPDQSTDYAHKPPVPIGVADTDAMVDILRRVGENITFVQGWEPPLRDTPKESPSAGAIDYWEKETPGFTLNPGLIIGRNPGDPVPPDLADPIVRDGAPDACGRGGTECVK